MISCLCCLLLRCFQKRLFRTSVYVPTKGLFLKDWFFSDINENCTYHRLSTKKHWVVSCKTGITKAFIFLQQGDLFTWFEPCGIKTKSWLFHFVSKEIPSLRFRFEIFLDVVSRVSVFVLIEMPSIVLILMWLCSVVEIRVGLSRSFL